MRRMALVAAFLVVTGTASAAMFVPAPAPEPPQAKPAKTSSIAPIARPSAPAMADAGRAPVPFVRQPPPPAPQITSLGDPPPDLSQIRHKSESSEADTAKAAIERGLANNGRCVGRPLTSVSVDGNGTVHIQC